MQCAVNHDDDKERKQEDRKGTQWLLRVIVLIFYFVTEDISSDLQNQSKWGSDSTRKTKCKREHQTALKRACLATVST